MQQPVIPGIDSLIEDQSFNRSLRIAFVTNNAANTNTGELSRVALLKNNFSIIKLFSPEHGLSVKGGDGVFQNNTTDAVTGLPVISLYGDRLWPTEEDLADVDLVLFDIPDVGCRFYTYLWTMTYMMEACAKYNTPLFILDRPNPIGGLLSCSEGPMLDEVNCTSFIGRWSIPVRHSCTLGELAIYFSKNKLSSLELDIIPVKNWHRDQYAGSPGFTFHPTSPAISNWETAIVYPGMGLLEGIHINEGRGTNKPFLKFGAPWIDANEFANIMNEKNYPGILFKPCQFIPSDSIYANEKCNGLSLSVVEKEIFKPVITGLGIITALFARYPDQVKERFYKTIANPDGSGHLDKLLGIKNIFKLLKAGQTISTDVSISWSQAISSSLLY